MMYNPETDKWSQGQIPSKGCDGGTVVTSGVYAPQTIYAISTSNSWVYDSINNTWLSITPMPTVRAGFGVAVLDDTLYVIGGYTSSDFFNWYNATTERVALNEQYIPNGYSKTEPDKSITAESNPNMFALIAIGLTVTIIVLATITVLAVKGKRDK
jgi:hypothetical protein